jgi:alkanesulfonate monooxygenase SsuD/methylene tetrahydromethanopterin reductase-like flavin-dependent oxidoreductase (luciferase family)
LRATSQGDDLVKLGIFMQPVHAPGGDLTENLARDRETIIHADRLGFHECWIGEHISAPVEPITTPLAFCASLMDATKDIKFGTGVFCLPQSHPATIAAHAAMFDHLVKGRFQMGIGPGGLSSDFEVYDVGDPAKRNRMMLESIDTILRLWSEDPPHDIKGEHWQVKLQDMSRRPFGVGEFIKPYQKPHPPIAISLMSPESANARVAGERGWIPISGASLVQPRNIASHWRLYEEGAASAGLKADRSVWRVVRSVWCEESDAAAEEYIAKPGGPFEFWFNYVFNAFGRRNTLHFVRPDGRENDETCTWLDVARDQIAHGSPKSVLEKLIALVDRLGPFGVLVLTAHEWDDVPRCKRSMELFAREVAPKLRQHVESRLKSH